MKDKTLRLKKLLIETYVIGGEDEESGSCDLLIIM